MQTMVDLNDCIKSESTRHQSILSSISAWLGHWRLNYTFCKIIYMCYKIFKWQKRYTQFRFTNFFWISFLAKANAKSHIYTLRCTLVTNWNATNTKIGWIRATYNTTLLMNRRQPTRKQLLPCAWESLNLYLFDILKNQKNQWSIHFCTYSISK